MVQCATEELRFLDRSDGCHVTHVPVSVTRVAVFRI